MQKRNCLNKLINKKHKTIIGLNSGTSADGIDAAAIRISGDGYRSKVKYICGATYKYDRKLKNRILKYAQPEFRDGVAWLELDKELAGLFASACKKIVKKAGLSLADIDLIGLHGQTIRHLPSKHGKSITFQIADPARIAAATGATTVGDFRVADTAAGGQGAPLTPIVNAILFGDKGKTVGVLNIGGIANISAIGYKAGKLVLFGCDTGPGNMLVDYICRKLFRKEYDRGGRLAFGGKIDHRMVNDLLEAKYYNERGPKSSGREQYSSKSNEKFIDRARSRYLIKEDILATASYLTCKAVEKCVKLNRLKLDLLLITGGGAKNSFMMKGLKELLPDVELKYAVDYGYPNDYLEAISFAVLANETICSNSYDLRNVTGSRKDVVLGKICQA